ncbi:MAG: class I lanthipeptide [Bacteroidota bacterium]|nr:class I lanthipeptide [Bacteroidota bacterium]
MKKKRFNKKLNLNKETISNLNNDEMSNIKGGSSWICVAATVAQIFVEGHENSYWACNLTHGGDEAEPMNSLEQGCTTNYNA